MKKESKIEPHPSESANPNVTTDPVSRERQANLISNQPPSDVGNENENDGHVRARSDEVKLVADNWVRLSKIPNNDPKPMIPTFINGDFKQCDVGEHLVAVYAVALSRDGKWIISGSRNKFVCFWDASGNLLKKFEAHSDHVQGIAFSPDANSIVSCSRDETVRLWNAAGDLLQEFKHPSSVSCVAFSPDGKFIISGSEDNSVRLWNVSSGELLKTFEGHLKGVLCVAFCPTDDGRSIVSGSWDKSIRLWDVASGKLLKEFKGHSKPVRSVAFSPNGDFILSGSDDESVRLWNVTSGKLLKVFEGHEGSVSCVCFSPNGEYILSGSGHPYNIQCDNTIRMWDIASCKEIRQLIHEDGVLCMSISRDGRILISGCKDGTVWLWKNIGRLLCLG